MMCVNVCVALHAKLVVLKCGCNITKHGLFATRSTQYNILLSCFIGDTKDTSCIRLLIYCHRLLYCFHGIYYDLLIPDLPQYTFECQTCVVFVFKPVYVLQQN